MRPLGVPESKLNLSSAVVPLISSRKDRSCLWTHPERGIHECGVASDCFFFHGFISFLVAKGAEPHLWPVSIRITETVAVERAVLPYRANPFLSGKVWAVCRKPSGPPWRAQISPVWRHAAVLQTPFITLHFVPRHGSISLMDGSPLKCRTRGLGGWKG